MWFGIGVLTLVGVFLFSLHVRTQALWKGEPRIGPGGVQFRYSESRDKNRKVTRVRIGLPAPRALVFKAREERWRDKFFKGIGLTVELQASDPGFDHAIYLESDLRALARVLSENAMLRDALIAIMQAARRFDLESLCVRCAMGRVWVQYTPRDKEADPDVVAQLVQRLQTVSQTLLANAVELAKARDPFFRTASILLSVASGAAALGGYGLLRSTIGRTDIVDAWPLFFASFVPGLIALAVLLVCVVGLLGRSSRAHTVLLEVMLVGGAGVIMSVYSLAREANIDFDSHAPERHELHGTSVEHRITRGRRGRRHHHYYLHAPDWRARHEGRSLRLEIDAAMFHQLEHAHDAVVVTRAGALGYEWVDHIESSIGRSVNY